eukprot:7185586-Lingulodinium_polyedra.AAC.1
MRSMLDMLDVLDVIAVIALLAGSLQQLPHLDTIASPTMHASLARAVPASLATHASLALAVLASVDTPTLRSLQRLRRFRPRPR